MSPVRTSTRTSGTEGSSARISASGALQVLLDVVREGAQRRDIEEPRLVGQAVALADQSVEAREKRRERLARSGRRRDQRVAALADPRPAFELRAVGSPRRVWNQSRMAGWKAPSADMGES